MPDFMLCVDKIQADPFAAPSRLHVVVPGRVAGFPAESFSTKVRMLHPCMYAGEQRKRACAVRRVGILYQGVHACVCVRGGADKGHVLYAEYGWDASCFFVACMQHSCT